MSHSKFTDGRGYPFSGAHTSPLNKGGRTLDSLGRKIYSSGTLYIVCGKYETIMRKYSMFFGEHISQHLDTQLDEVVQADSIKLGEQQNTVAIVGCFIYQGVVHLTHLRVTLPYIGEELRYCPLSPTSLFSCKSPPIPPFSLFIGSASSLPLELSSLFLALPSNTLAQRTTVLLSGLVHCLHTHLSFPGLLLRLFWLPLSLPDPTLLPPSESGCWVQGPVLQVSG